MEIDLSLGNIAYLLENKIPIKKTIKENWGIDSFDKPIEPEVQNFLEKLINEQNDDPYNQRFFNTIKIEMNNNLFDVDEVDNKFIDAHRKKNSGFLKSNLKYVSKLPLSNIIPNGIFDPDAIINILNQFMSIKNMAELIQKASDGHPCYDVYDLFHYNIVMVMSNFLWMELKINYIDNGTLIGYEYVDSCSYFNGFSSMEDYDRLIEREEERFELISKMNEHIFSENEVDHSYIPSFNLLQNMMVPMAQQRVCVYSTNIFGLIRFLTNGPYHLVEYKELKKQLMDKLIEFGWKI
jgi:hypothetical protein